MKNFAHWLLSLTLSLPVLAAPRVVWVVSEGLAQPESAYYDAGTDAVYVSSISGEGLGKDKKGWISKISRDGKMLSENWFKELDAPKGIRTFKNVLWVTDIDRVVSIDLKTAKQLQSIEIEGAKFLNDVAIAKNGDVFVSDTAGNRIHRITDGKAEVFLEGPKLEAPNGLLVQEPYLRVAGWGTGVGPDLSTTGPGSLYKVHLETKKVTFEMSALGNLDGIELGFGGVKGVFLSDWVKGVIFYTAGPLPETPLLAGIEGAADIGTIPQDELLLVPSMAANTVTAYHF